MVRGGDQGVDVTFEHGAPRRFGLVIGADGLHSTVRRLTFGDESQFRRYIAATSLCSQFRTTSACRVEC